jgi:hypothetical protein
LAALRDISVFPFINRADTARTIYPPAAQVLFLLVQEIRPGVFGIKCAMVGAELMAVGALLALLRRAGLPRTRVLIYTWHPLPVWEFAGNGHVDALAIACLALALMAAAADRGALAGIALAGAVLSKVLPGVLLPSLWRGRGWSLPVAFAATIMATYFPYLGAGAHVLGYLPGYVSEEGIASGRGIYFLDLLAQVIVLPAWAGVAYLAAVLGLLALLAWRMRSPPADVAGLAHDALTLGTVLTVAITPHYAWYFGWLLVPSCVAPAWPILVLTVLSFTIYQDPFDATLFWPAVIYLPFFALLLPSLRRPPTEHAPPVRSR